MPAVVLDTVIWVSQVPVELTSPVGKNETLVAALLDAALSPPVSLSARDWMTKPPLSLTVQPDLVPVSAKLT